MFPEHTPAYLKARAPLLAKFAEARAPHWQRYLAGKIDHAQYRDLIELCSLDYGDALEDAWVEAGGKPMDKAERERRKRVRKDKAA